MKNIFFTILLLFFAIKITAQQQPEFKFYLAFEDAANTKDTLWYILDSTATWGIDTALGEAPQDLTSNDFHVYLRPEHYGVLVDSGELAAFQSLSCAAGGQIHAQNYIYPIIVRWDTSLFFNHNLSCNFNEVIFDNEWFFFNTNDPGLSMFSLLLQDSVVLPSFSWGSQGHFPLMFILGNNPQLSLDENSVDKLTVKGYPNPTDDIYIMEMNNSELPFHIIISDLSGRIMFQQKEITTNKITLNLQGLPQGVYFLEILIENEKVVKKIIKN